MRLLSNTFLGKYLSFDRLGFIILSATMFIRTHFAMGSVLDIHIICIFSHARVAHYS